MKDDQQKTTMMLAGLWRGRDDTEYALLWPDHGGDVGLRLNESKRLFVIRDGAAAEAAIASETEQRGMQGGRCAAGLRYDTDAGTLDMYWEDSIRDRFNDTALKPLRLKRDNLRVVAQLRGQGVDVVPHPAWRKL